MSASGEESGSSGVISTIVDIVIDRLLGRLISTILLVGGFIGSGFVEIGDALESGLLDPFEYIGGALGSVGESLLSVARSLDLVLLSISYRAGIAAPLVLLLSYALIGAIVGGLTILILRVSRRVIPVL